MNIFVSGFCEQEAVSPGYSQDGNVHVQWLDPEDFLLAASQAHEKLSDEKWMWFYRSPWSILLSPSCPFTNDFKDMIFQWTGLQRSALKLFHTSGLDMILVNRDSVPSAALHTSFGLDLSLPNDFLKQSDLVSVLGKLFEWIDPHSWDVLEALEAVSWNPDGNPLLRSYVDTPCSDVLMEVATLLKNGQQIPELLDEIKTKTQVIEQSKAEKAAFTQSHDELTRLASERQTALDELTEQYKSDSTAHQQKQEQAEQTIKEIKEENELLLLQLHQVQEELERYFLAGQDMSDTLTKSQETMRNSCMIIGKLMANNTNGIINH